MRREPLGAMTNMPGDAREPGDSGPGDSGGDAFGRIVEAAIRNGRLSAAEIRELRTLVAAAFRLAPADDTPAADVDWRTPPDQTVH